MTADPIRIFVGCPANNEDLECQAVLEYSLRSHTARPLDITWMMLSRDRASFWYSNPAERNSPPGTRPAEAGWLTKWWATPFSALRWGIPAACGYQGRAIYLDSDMIAMADIGELWDQDIPRGKVLLAKGGDEFISCVMLMDCAAMQPLMPPIDAIKGELHRYRHVRRDLKGHVADYRNNWNCRDGERYESIFDPDIKILHYTHIPTQPNHKHARARLAREGKKHWYPGPDLPHARPEFNELFDRLLIEAADAGYPLERYRVAREFGEYGMAA